MIDGKPTATATVALIEMCLSPLEEQSRLLLASPEAFFDKYILDSSFHRWRDI
jgi:hypothetical protein